MRAPMIGRDREMGLLLAAFERSARERRAVLCTVAGTPGIGKTRLLESSSTRSRTTRSSCRAAAWPTATASPSGRRPRPVRLAAGITPGDPAPEALEKLASLLGQDDDAVGRSPG
jgi:hypothetical protein